LELEHDTADMGDMEQDDDGYVMMEPIDTTRRIYPVNTTRRMYVFIHPGINGFR
jgi:hypothetical protein